MRLRRRFCGHVSPPTATTRVPLLRQHAFRYRDNTRSVIAKPVKNETKASFAQTDAREFIASRECVSGVRRRIRPATVERRCLLEGFSSDRRFSAQECRRNAPE